MSRKIIKEWATIFRGMGNPNRLRIIKILSETGELSVSELAKELKITLKNTSRNLLILQNLGIVEFQGKIGRVYYSLNLRIERDISQIINVVLK